MGRFFVWAGKALWNMIQSFELIVQMIRLPVSLIAGNLDRLNISTDEDGNITHWHMVFFKDPTGHMTWMFSKPEIEEISVDEYLT